MSPLAEAVGPAVDVLDANGFELVLGGIQSFAVLLGVDELVQQRGGWVSRHDSPGVAVARVLQRAAEIRVPMNRAQGVAALIRGGSIVSVALGPGIGADAETPLAPLELMQQGKHLRGFAARVDAAPNSGQGLGDQRLVRFARRRSPRQEKHQNAEKKGST